MTVRQKRQNNRLATVDSKMRVNNYSRLSIVVEIVFIVLIVNLPVVLHHYDYNFDGGKSGHQDTTMAVIQSLMFWGFLLWVPDTVRKISMGCA